MGYDGGCFSVRLFCLSVLLIVLWYVVLCILLAAMLVCLICLAWCFVFCGWRLLCDCVLVVCVILLLWLRLSVSGFPDYCVCWVFVVWCVRFWLVTVGVCFGNWFACGLLFRFASAGLVAICLVLVGFVWFVVCNLCFVFGCLLVCGGFGRLRWFGWFVLN